MKRLAPLALILLLVICSTGCRRGLRLWGLRGAPCQPGGAAAAPGLGGPLAGVLGGSPLGGAALGGVPQLPAAAPVACPTCCPSCDCCPPVDCGCATGGLPSDPAYAGAIGGVQGFVGGGQIPGGMLADGTEVPLSDAGFDIRPGESLGQIGTPVVGPSTGTANALPAIPASIPPVLPLQ